MADSSSKIQVQMCFAKQDKQILLNLSVPQGTTLQQAIFQSGILQEVPEIDLATDCVGIYGKRKMLDTVLRDRDRIEIYRPLIADPKEARRRRAGQK